MRLRVQVFAGHTRPTLGHSAVQDVIVTTKRSRMPLSKFAPGLQSLLEACYQHARTDDAGMITCLSLHDGHIVWQNTRERTRKRIEMFADAAADNEVFDA